MKKLIGIKNHFSLFENKELKNLQSTVGGLAAALLTSIESASEPGIYQYDMYADDGRYLGRVIVG